MGSRALQGFEVLWTASTVASNCDDSDKGANGPHLLAERQGESCDRIVGSAVQCLMLSGAETSLVR